MTKKVQRKIWLDLVNYGKSLGYCGWDARKYAVREMKLIAKNLNKKNKI